MKLRQHFCYIASAAAIVLVCAFAASAQRTGGYKKIEKTDADARAAAEFAVHAEAEKDSSTITLVEVENAERQIVAGTNFRLCLKVSTAKGDGPEVPANVQVVVYRNLKGEYKLTSWAASKCEDEDDG